MVRKAGSDPDLEDRLPCCETLGQGFLSWRVSLCYHNNYNNYHHNTTMTQPASKTPLLAFSAPVVLSGGRGVLGSCQLVQVWTGPTAGWPVMPPCPAHHAAMGDPCPGASLCSSWTEWLSEPRFDVLLGHTPSPFRLVVAGQKTSEAEQRPEQGGHGQCPHRNLAGRDTSPSRAPQADLWGCRGLSCRAGRET